MHENRAIWICGVGNKSRLSVGTNSSLQVRTFKHVGIKFWDGSWGVGNVVYYLANIKTIDNIQLIFFWININLSTDLKNLHESHCSVSVSEFK